MTASKSILYIGNKLLRHGRTPTSIDTLGPLLERYYTVRYASDKKKKWLRFLHMMYAVLRWARHTDLVLIATYSTANFYYAWAAALLARMLGVPYVPILHGGELPRRLKSSPRLSRSLFGHAAINAAPSPYNARFFKEAGFKVTVIPNMIRLPDYPFKVRTAFRPRLLWVRSLDAIYNPWMAIDVLALLKPRYPEACLLMVGPDKGVMRAVQDYAEKKGLAGAATFTGVLPKEEWRARAADYDIFINTTNKDNTPVSVVEAMALGLPVVTTRVGGIPFLWKHREHALLVPPRDPEAMAKAIVEIIENPDDTRRMVRRARHMVEAFDERRVLEQWKTLIDRLIDRQRRNP